MKPLVLKRQQRKEQNFALVFEIKLKKKQKNIEILSIISMLTKLLKM